MCLLWDLYPQHVSLTSAHLAQRFSPPEGLLTPPALICYPLTCSVNNVNLTDLRELVAQSPRDLILWRLYEHP